MKMTTSQKSVGAIAAYAIAAIVTFGAVSAGAKAECDSRAYDALKCRAQTALPAAIFWPFTIAYVAGDFAVQ